MGRAPPRRVEWREHAMEGHNVSWCSMQAVWDWLCSAPTSTSMTVCASVCSVAVLLIPFLLHPSYPKTFLCSPFFRLLASLSAQDSLLLACHLSKTAYKTYKMVLAPSFPKNINGASFLSDRTWDYPEQRILFLWCVDLRFLRPFVLHWWRSEQGPSRRAVSREIDFSLLSDSIFLRGAAHEIFCTLTQLPEFRVHVYFVGYEGNVSKGILRYLGENIAEENKPKMLWAVLFPQLGDFTVSQSFHWVSGTQII